MCFTSWRAQSFPVRIETLREIADHSLRITSRVTEDLTSPFPFPYILMLRASSSNFATFLKQLCFPVSAPNRTVRKHKWISDKPDAYVSRSAVIVWEFWKLLEIRIEMYNQIRVSRSITTNRFLIIYNWSWSAASAPRGRIRRSRMPLC